MIQELLDNLPKDILLNMPHNKLIKYINEKFIEIGFIKTDVKGWNWNKTNKMLYPDSIMFRQIFKEKSEMRYFISSEPNKAIYERINDILCHLVRIDVVWLEIVHGHLSDLPPPELIYKNLYEVYYPPKSRGKWIKCKYKSLSNNGGKKKYIPFYPLLSNKVFRLNYILVFKNHINNQEYWIEPDRHKKYKIINLVEEYKKVACQLAGENECIFKKPSKN